jgi:hypothetical protein
MFPGGNQLRFSLRLLVLLLFGILALFTGLLFLSLVLVLLAFVSHGLSPFSLFLFFVPAWPSGLPVSFDPTLRELSCSPDTPPFVWAALSSGGSMAPETRTSLSFLT